MTVLITLTTAGNDTGPFNLYSNVDGYTIAFATGITRSQLVSGYTSSTVPTDTVTVLVQSTGTCNRDLYLIVDGAPTPPPPPPPGTRYNIQMCSGENPSGTIYTINATDDITPSVNLVYRVYAPTFNADMDGTNCWEVISSTTAAAQTDAIFGTAYGTCTICNQTIYNSYVYAIDFQDLPYGWETSTDACTYGSGGVSIQVFYTTSTIGDGTVLYLDAGLQNEFGAQGTHGWYYTNQSGGKRFQYTEGSSGSIYNYDSCTYTNRIGAGAYDCEGGGFVYTGYMPTDFCGASSGDVAITAGQGAVSINTQYGFNTVIYLYQESTNNWRQFLTGASIAASITFLNPTCTPC
jgi:hypothetical protein